MHFDCTIICTIVRYISQLLSPWAPDYTILVCIDDNPHITCILMPVFFHIRTVIIPRVDIARGMITVLIWKKASIDLFIIYFNIELKRTKLTSQTHTKLWVIDIGWGMITVLIWKKACIVLFIKRLDIMLSEFCPDFFPCAGIAVALPVFTYGDIDVITYKYVINVN